LKIEPQLEAGGLYFACRLDHSSKMMIAGVVVVVVLVLVHVVLMLGLVLVVLVVLYLLLGCDAVVLLC